MFTWRKLGKIFDPAAVSGRPWWREFAQAPSALVLDDRVRVYVSCRPEQDRNGQYISYSAFVDLSREDMRTVVAVCDKPILELGDPGCFDEYGTYPVSVIRHGHMVWAYYGGWTRCESVPFNVAVGLAMSYDNGLSFRKYGPGPVLSYTPDEPFIISGPKIRRFNGAWYLWYIAGRKWVESEGRREPVYKIRMATSSDGITWRRMNRDVIESRIEENEAQASPDVTFSNGKYHMFFSYRHSMNYRHGSRGYRIGYAASDNLVDWVRDDSRAGIDVSEHGWDSEMISYPHLLELDGRIYMFYLGNEVGRCGFGLAQLEGELR